MDKNADTPVPPASMSKLMTLNMLFEALRDAVGQAGGQPGMMNAPATAEEVLRAVSG